MAGCQIRTKEDRRQWLNLHLICGVKTNIVTSVEVTFKTNSVPQSGYEPKSQLWTRMYHFSALNRAEFL